MNMPQQDQRIAKLKQFYNNTAIQSIADTPRWSISTNTKKPLDMYELDANGTIRFCDIDMHKSATTLSEVDRIFEKQSKQSVCSLSNHAFFLDVLEDNIVILDVEPKCPSSIVAGLLRLPYIYGERSMSGKGFHLVFPKPKNFNDFPTAAKKVALKDESKYFEILLNHWITFTGNTLPCVTGDNINNQEPFEKFYAKLAQEQKETPESDIDFELRNIDISDIPDSDYILELLINGNHYNKSPDDFHNDMSSYEYGWFAHTYRKMQMIFKLSCIRENKHTYTLNERAAMLIEIAKTKLPYRSKHDQWKLRGISWFEYLSKCIISRNTSQDELKQLTKGDISDV